MSDMQTNNLIQKINKMITPKYIKYTLLILLGGWMLNSCKTTKNGNTYKEIDIEAKNAEIQINLRSPINTVDGNELGRDVYKDKTYFFVQKKDAQFKDNAPFIQYLDGGKKERLWFSSSRSDEFYNLRKRTNYYQQIYFCEREIGEGKCAWEGWSKPQRLVIANNNTMLASFINSFNSATKGTLTAAGNKLIFACDQLTDNLDNGLLNLWTVSYENGKFDVPQPLNLLSSAKTWESQPTLSANGKHLFFVSNRLVNKTDLTCSTQETDDNINIYYSFCNEEGQWGEPVLVKELYSTDNEITPQINPKGNILYFSSDKSGDYEIYEVSIQLDDNVGGYHIEEKSVELFRRPLIDNCSNELKSFNVNGAFNQKYPFYYYNSLNKKAPQSFFWAADNPKGMGSYDIYGCNMPFVVDYNVVLVDMTAANSPVEFPVIKITGDLELQNDAVTANYTLYSGQEYQVYGGSTACPEKGTFYCDQDEKYLFTGYSGIVNIMNPADRAFHNKRLNGAEVGSVLTDDFGYIPIFNVLQDTVVADTIRITKAWTPKPPCPDVLNIPQKYESIPYFQTGYWEVNTVSNLKRDLEKLHDGYEVVGTNDIYNPKEHIVSHRSGYKAYDWETPLSPIKLNDKHLYSIADARWIELHPFNYYWGDRAGFGSSLEERMKGRKKRIEEYVDYADKVDENLKILTDTITQKYISFLDLHKKRKPRLLIEIFAVSDQREILRGWYIGDTVQYRSYEYKDGDFTSPEYIKIIPPKVDEESKKLTEITPCTIQLNANGNNGCELENINLSRLRAWYGYKEIYNRLAESENFGRYLKNNKVALPDNNLSFDDAEIIIISHAINKEVINPKSPYPSVNNPNGQGFYDFDQIRRVEIRIRLLMNNENEETKDYCCYSKK